MVQGRHCSCCKRSGHTVATCTAPGSGRIRELLRLLRLRSGQRKGKRRVRVKKFGGYKKAARKKYTPNPVVEHNMQARRRLRDQRVTGLNGRKEVFMRDDAVPLDSALRQLKVIKCWDPPKKCPECGVELDQKVHSNKNGDHQRCNQYDCNVRFPVMKHTPFGNFRMKAPVSWGLGDGS